jgi:cellobiose phosphorylase
MYRLVVESLLGLKLEGDSLRFAPCMPPEWSGFALRYRYRETSYQIAVRRTEMVGDGRMDTTCVTLDGVAQDIDFIRLADDRQEHEVEVHIRSMRPVPQMIAV